MTKGVKDCTFTHKFLLFEEYKMERRLWTRDEMILAFNLYLKMPFGKISSRNPRVKELAALIGRTDNSVALRLVNYASCDPILQARGVSGMSGGKNVCQPYWDEFYDDREALVFESERILAKYQHTDIETKFQKELLDIPEGVTGETRVREVKTRVNQNVFRQIVLANYDEKCGLTGIDIPELLVASHIIPWKDDKENRLNPENGICLSSLYDKAFDQGLISFDNESTVLFSDRLEKNAGKDYYNKYFVTVKGKKLNIPRKYHPNSSFLEWHRDCVFNKI